MQTHKIEKVYRLKYLKRLKEFYREKNTKISLIDFETKLQMDFIVKLSPVSGKETDQFCHGELGEIIILN